MIGKGLLARQRSASDARANTVSLTAQGRTALDEAQPKVAAADERILQLLPARKRDAFLAVLREIAAELSDDVWVSAPEQNKSGAGHSLSLNEPLRLRALDERRFATRGTP